MAEYLPSNLESIAPSGHGPNPACFQSADFKLNIPFNKGFGTFVVPVGSGRRKSLEHATQRI